MRRRQKKWRSAGEDIVAALTGLGLTEAATKVRIQMVWETAVGAGVAAQAQPERFERGTLTVRVRTATWQNELTFMQKQIVDGLNAALGRKIVRDLRVVAGTVQRKQAATPLPAATPREHEHAETVGKTIDDDELRQSFTRCMETSYRANRAAGKRPNLRS